MTDKVSVIRGPKDVVGKTRAATRSMTTGTAVMTLPKGSRILYFTSTGVASDAATTATLSVGTSATSNEYVSAYDVKTAANGVGPVILPSVSGTLGVVLTEDTPIYFKYAETGTASTVGNWWVTCVYTQSNVVNNDTV